MKIRSIFSTPVHSTFGDMALLLLRLVVGVAFMIYGKGKIQTPFTWMGPDAPVPGFLQGLAALSEFGGGLALIVGLLVPLASFGIACTMAVATAVLVQRGIPFISKDGSVSYSLPIFLFCIAIVFIALGPGRISLDRRVFGARAASSS